MEIRRVQITGGSSFMITLPKDWASARGLKKNDPVMAIPQSDGSLLLTTGEESGVKESVKVLNLDGFETPVALYRCLIGAYIAGHDQIVLTSDGPINGSFLEVISEFTQTSMGMEIIEEDEDRIVIKDLINHSEVIPQKNVKREYLLVKRMVADAMSADRPAISEMAARDTEVDRIHWLVQRQARIHQLDIGLSSKMGLRPGTVSSCMGVSKILERMGDHAVLLVKNLDSMDPGAIANVGLMLDSLRVDLLDYIEKSMKSWMDADSALAETVICGKSDMLSHITGCFLNASETLLMGSLTRIVEYCSDIAESAINLAMEN